MTGTVRAARRTPTRPAPAGQGRPRPAGTRATGTDRTPPPGTDTARAGAVHPVPKSFRSKERQS
ncbi:hypothetical protein ACFV8T_42080 [Streptomyces sp. NPDC059832]|uniref:hypothetical protein n=1 Tax=Streptomyces sp. NPDC059832 TaxID=3346966 RepID=UPI0036631C6E